MAIKNFYIPLTSEDRIRVEIHTVRGQVHNFTVQYELLLNRNWTAVVRYDTAHGYPHMDVMHPGSGQEKIILRTSDLAEALNFAIGDLKLRWNHYRDRYIGELKNEES